MASFHRKLILDSLNETLTDEICSSFCEEKDDDPSGFCPNPCLTLCSEICHYPLDSSVPPPPPPVQSIPPISSFIDSETPHKVSLFLIVPITSIAAVFLILFCYALFLKFNSSRNQRRRSEPELDHTHEEFLDENQESDVDHHIWYIRTVGLQSSIINSIAVCKYRRDEGLVEGTECSVCLNEFQEDETLRLLPKCNHAFHIPCIDTWLRSHTNCPMCRAPIIRHVVSAVPEPGSLVVEGENRGGVEAETEIEDEGNELRIEIEEDGGELGIENEIQPIRRSVSLDSLSASKISVSIGNLIEGESNGNLDTQLGNLDNQLGNLNTQLGNLNTHLGKVSKSTITIVPRKVCGNQSLLRLMGSSSIGRYQQRGSMKRSLSCNRN